MARLRPADLLRYFIDPEETGERKEAHRVVTCGRRDEEVNKHPWSERQYTSEPDAVYRED